MEIDKKIDEYLNNKEDKIRERSYFYVSEVGKSKKEIYNDFKNPKSKKFEARVKRILDNGDYMHMRFYKYLAEMGVLIAAEVDAVKTDLVHGRADAIITDGQKLYVLDLKSCSQWTFNKLKGADPAHELQLMLYMYYLNIPQGIILYECKDNQTIKTYLIALDKQKIEKLIQELARLKEMINNNIEPEDKPIYLEEIQYGI
jgi:CRISPR/Cas system-associated exonuclease Cas4 (RecB family)